MSQSIYDGLTQLGGNTAQPASPEEAVLERVPNPHRGTAYLVRFAAPEFTSLCPITGQPDFAHLVIDYVPRDWIVPMAMVPMAQKPILIMTQHKGVSIKLVASGLKPLSRLTKKKPKNTMSAMG